MNSQREFKYRIGLASGFFAEAEQDYDLKRWRSCVDNSQLAIENSAKAILALFEIPPKTHDPAKHLTNLVKNKNLIKSISQKIESLLPDIIAFGLEEHIMTDYGDEATLTLPWDIFTEESASDALTTARKCVEGTNEIYTLRIADDI